MVVVHESARPSCISLVSYGPDEIEVVEQATVAQAKALRGKRGVLWVHVEGLGNGQLISELGDAFSLHSLALEDCATLHQQVKVEDYGNHLFIVSRMIGDTMGHDTRQLSMFLSEQVVITLHDEPTKLLSALRPRLTDSRSQLRHQGSDFLADAVLDLVRDQYFPTANAHFRQLGVAR